MTKADVFGIKVLEAFDDEAFECQICQRKFQFEESMQRHMENCGLDADLACLSDEEYPGVEETEANASEEHEQEMSKEHKNEDIMMMNEDEREINNNKKICHLSGKSV